MDNRLKCIVIFSGWQWVSSMELILHGNSEHVAHACGKPDLIRRRKIKFATSVDKDQISFKRFNY